MKAAAVAFMLLALAAGCSRHTSSPSASPGSYTSKSSCERAGYAWDSASGICK